MCKFFCFHKLFSKFFSKSLGTVKLNFLPVKENTGLKLARILMGHSRCNLIFNKIFVSVQIFERGIDRMCIDMKLCCQNILL